MAPHTATRKKIFNFNRNNPNECAPYDFNIRSQIVQKTSMRDQAK